MIHGTSLTKCQTFAAGHFYIYLPTGLIDVKLSSIQIKSTGVVYFILILSASLAIYVLVNVERATV